MESSPSCLATGELVVTRISFATSTSPGTGGLRATRFECRNQSLFAAGQFLGLKRSSESVIGRQPLGNRPWTWTTSNAKVVRRRAAVGRAVVVGPDGEQLRSWR